MKRVLAPLLIVLIFVSIISGCTTSTSTTVTSKPATQTVATPTASATPKYGGILRLLYDTAPAASIGYFPEALGDSLTGPAVSIETLLRLDSKGNIQPWLVESYQVSDDNKFVTLKIRRGVKFHDGSDLNAQVVKWCMDLKIAAKQAPNWVSTVVVDDYTVRVNLVEWQNKIINTFDSVMIISKESFDKNGIEYTRSHPVGTGPFIFVSYEKDAKMTFKKNPNYWQSGKPYLDGIEFIFVADKTTQIAVMKSGQADGLMLDPGKVMADITADGLVVKCQVNAISALLPDTVNTDSPWANKKVREAVEYAIDKEAIAKGLGYGYLHAPYQIPAPASSAWDPNFASGRKYDPAKAKQLLTEAGYPTGFKTNIIISPSSLNRDMVMAMQSYLKSVNIQADLEFTDLAKFQAYGNSTWQGAIYEPLSNSSGNFNNLLDLTFSPDRKIHGSWLRTPEFIQLYKASLTAPTIDVTKIKAVTNYLSQEALIIPINEGGKGWAIQPYVMDAGFLERGLPAYFKSEQAWLNK